MITHLPLEILTLITEFLTPRDEANLRMCNSTFILIRKSKALKLKELEYMLKKGKSSEFLENQEFLPDLLNIDDLSKIFIVSKINEYIQVEIINNINLEILVKMFVTKQNFIKYLTDPINNNLNYHNMMMLLDKIEINSKDILNYMILPMIDKKLISNNFNQILNFFDSSIDFPPTQKYLENFITILLSSRWNGRVFGILPTKQIAFHIYKKEKSLLSQKIYMISKLFCYNFKELSLILDEEIDFYVFLTYELNL
jgi:hypothetical protein